jgi:hypothetical protein
VLQEQLGRRRLRFTDAQRRRLAVKGRAVGRRRLGEFAGLVAPDTILRWYRELIARKYDGSARRRTGRPTVAIDVEQLVGVATVIRIGRSLPHIPRALRASAGGDSAGAATTPIRAAAHGESRVCAFS